MSVTLSASIFSHGKTYALALDFHASDIFLQYSGEYLKQWPFEFAPTYEGMNAGMLHVFRLVTMLAGLSLLLTTTSREHLIAGFYLLSRPLEILNLKPEKFAARLCLTLYYVESSPRLSLSRSLVNQFIRSDANETTRNMNELTLPQHHNDAPQHISLETPAFSRCDWLILLVVFFSGILLL